MNLHANLKLCGKQTNFSCSFNYNSSIPFKLLCLSCIKFGNVYEHAESTQKVTTRRHSRNHPALIKSRPVNSCLKLHFVMAVLFRCQGRTARSTSAQKNIKTTQKKYKYDTERNNCCVRWLGAMKIYEFLSPDFPPREQKRERKPSLRDIKV